ncbi:hypothetical protein Salat_1614500 [Sesamum alatum]|uniref:Uncharacterized protein n=1 Tax=Sesamum alatum TaxID=300844 RepID=A0AAE1Y5N5_9LAMI|nr:hypothetical protein Salat_1614500 [Sesamum alatum]
MSIGCCGLLSITTLFRFVHRAQQMTKHLAISRPSSCSAARSIQLCGSCSVADIMVHGRFSFVGKALCTARHTSIRIFGGTRLFHTCFQCCLCQDGWRGARGCNKWVRSWLVVVLGWCALHVSGVAGRWRGVFGWCGGDGVFWVCRRREEGVMILGEGLTAKVKVGSGSGCGSGKGLGRVKFMWGLGLGWCICVSDWADSDCGSGKG